MSPELAYFKSLFENEADYLAFKLAYPLFEFSNKHPFAGRCGTTIDINEPNTDDWDEDDANMLHSYRSTSSSIYLMPSMVSFYRVGHDEDESFEFMYIDTTTNNLYIKVQYSIKGVSIGSISIPANTDGTFNKVTAIYSKLGGLDLQIEQTVK